MKHKFPDQCGGYRNQSHRKEPNIIDPVNSFRYILSEAEHIMMVVPSHGNKKEANGVGE